MEYQCSLCREKVEGDLITLKDHTDNHVIDLIKHDHPEWIQKDGMCQKCIDYYSSEIKGSTFGTAKCAIRRRGINNFLNSIKNIFKS